MSDIEFIRKFSKITVKGACDQAGVNKSNIWSDKAKEDNIKAVKKILIISMLNLLKDEVSNEN